MTGDSQVRGDVSGGGGGDPPAEVRHRTLSELERTVQRHPAVVTAAGARGDGGRFRELAVTFDLTILGIDADEAGLRIVWRPRPDASETAYFVFHCHESTGRDFGWHREPNAHVNSLEHYQERQTADAQYEYEATQFEATSPVELVWEILGRIE